MNKKQVLAIIGLGAAGLAVYRSLQRVEEAVERYRRRGLQPDVVLLGAIAAISLYMAADQGGRAVKRAKRAF